MCPCWQEEASVAAVSQPFPSGVRSPPAWWWAPWKPDKLSSMVSCHSVSIKWHSSPPRECQHFVLFEGDSAGPWRPGSVNRGRDCGHPDLMRRWPGKFAERRGDWGVWGISFFLLNALFIGWPNKDAVMPLSPESVGKAAKHFLGTADLVQSCNRAERLWAQALKPGDLSPNSALLFSCMWLWEI